MDQNTTGRSERLRDLDVVEQIRRKMGHEDNTTLLAAENLVHLLRTYSVVYDALTDGLAPFDLSLPQYNLLAILYSAPGRHLPMSGIGERMSVTRTNITKLVDCLERAGLVRRADWPSDRRVVLAELTEKGEALVRRVMPHQFKSVRRLWTEMDEEDCLQLTHLLLKLRNSITAVAQAHPAESKHGDNALALNSRQ